jgi:hypothetical protein
MKNFKMTDKLARVTGVVVLLLAGMVFGQTEITCIFMGDAGAVNVEVTATPTEPSTGGGVLSNKNSVTFRNLSGSWTGGVSAKIMAGYYGFTVGIGKPGQVRTPADTQYRGLLLTKDTLYFTVKDTAKPVVKLSHLKGTILYINQLFTFYDSILDNSMSLSSIRHDYSVDGKIWDSINYKQGPVPTATLIYTGYQQTFTPKKAADSFMLRAIAVDRFGLADTDVVVFMVKDFVGVINMKKIQPRATVGNNFTYDLSGRKLSTRSKHNPPKFYIKNNQRFVSIHQ